MVCINKISKLIKLILIILNKIRNLLLAGMDDRLAVAAQPRRNY
jgi:hypothetical protein